MLKEVVCDVVDWIHLAHGSDHLRALRFPYKAGSFVEQPSNYQLPRNSSTESVAAWAPAVSLSFKTHMEQNRLWARQDIDCAFCFRAVEYNARHAHSVPNARHAGLSVHTIKNGVPGTVSLTHSSKPADQALGNACKGRLAAALMCQRSCRTIRRYCTHQQVNEKKPAHLTFRRRSW
jgi:hypothetical protein